MIRARIKSRKSFTRTGMWRPGGRTAQMTPLIAALVSAGYSVLALDAPGHGDSGWRSRSSIVHFSKAVDQLLGRHGPAFASVAHSLGASAVAHSQARGAPTGPLVLIAPFSKPERFYQGFMSHLGFDAEATAAAQHRAEAELGVRFADLDLARNLAASPAPTWIIHDRSDKRVPFHGSERVAAKVPGLHLHATDGLGHGRVLADADVHRVIVNALDALPGPRIVVGSSPSSSTRVFVPTMGELLADLEYGRA